MKWLDVIEARRKAWWPELDVREQRMILAAGTLVLVALFWWVALAPALRTLSSAPAEHAQLDAQLQQMINLQAQAKALQSQPRASRDDAMRSLETSVRQNPRRRRLAAVRRCRRRCDQCAAGAQAGSAGAVVYPSPQQRTRGAS